MLSLGSRGAEENYHTQDQKESERQGAKCRDHYLRLSHGLLLSRHLRREYLLLGKALRSSDPLSGRPHYTHEAAGPSRPMGDTAPADGLRPGQGNGPLVSLSLVVCGLPALNGAQSTPTCSSGRMKNGSALGEAAAAWMGPGGLSVSKQGRGMRDTCASASPPDQMLMPAAEDFVTLGGKDQLAALG
jgi:hypothetical protein